MGKRFRVSSSLSREANQPFLFCKVSDMNLPGNELYIRNTQNTIDRTAATEMGVRLHPAGTIIFENWRSDNHQQATHPYWPDCY